MFGLLFGKKTWDCSFLLFGKLTMRGIWIQMALISQPFKLFKGCFKLHFLFDIPVLEKIEIETYSKCSLFFFVQVCYHISLLKFVWPALTVKNQGPVSVSPMASAG